MKPRIATAIVLGIVGVLFALTIAWPTVALIGRCLTDGRPPQDGFSFSNRQLALLWRSTYLAVAATAVCILLSLPAAFVMGRLRRLSDRPMIPALLLSLILCPSTVLAFGWDRILPSAFHGQPRCVAVWALWAWPIPSMLIGVGWSRLGQRAFEEALLVASPVTAFLRIALPTVRNHVVLAGLILFVLFFGDYGVPHACLLQVYATELLGWARSSPHPIDSVWPALPSVGVVMVVLATAWGTARTCTAQDDVAAPEPAPTTTSSNITTLAVLCFSVSWLLPLAALTVKLSSLRALEDAFRVYGPDLLWSLALACVAGVVAIGLGVGLVPGRRFRAPGLLWALLLGALPGALVGEALVAAYNHDATWWIYDRWPIMPLCYVTRFAWVGIVTALIAIDRRAPLLVDQARTDGATPLSILARLHLPLTFPALLCGAAVAAALSVADVAASALVRVPTFTPVAHVLFEKFHRFEDDMLISLSLWLVAATLPAAILLAAALRTRRRD
ncbi:MAG: hypothetical protein PVI86_19850 [Phycisphaerae bacterium]